jgi:assimilatory nitrate reductase catalytic subunit
MAEPFVELHTDDAARLGLTAADLAEVESTHGRAVLRVVVQDRQRPGAAFAPMHWTGETAAAGRVNALVTPATDPISGQPASKSSRVTVRRFIATVHGFALTRRRPVTDGLPYFAVGKTESGHRLEFADTTIPPDPVAFAARLFGVDQSAPRLNWVTLIDARSGRARIAARLDGRIEGIVYLDRAPVAVARAFAVQLFDDPNGGKLDALLAGRAGSGDHDPGRTVCACLGVGVNAITGAITRGHTTVAGIGEATGAGTNCGSCRSEIARLIDDATAPQSV